MAFLDGRTIEFNSSEKEILLILLFLPPNMATVQTLHSVLILLVEKLKDFCCELKPRIKRQMSESCTRHIFPCIHSEYGTKIPTARLCLYLCTQRQFFHRPPAKQKPCHPLHRSQLMSGEQGPQKQRILMLEAK